MAEKNSYKNSKFIVNFINVNKQMGIPLSYDEFKKEVCSLYKIKESKFDNLEVKYLDSEKDLIYLSDKADYEQLLLSIKDNSIVELYMNISQKSIIEFHSKIEKNSKIENVPQKPEDVPIKQIDNIPNVVKNPPSKDNRENINNHIQNLPPQSQPQQQSFGFFSNFVKNIVGNLPKIEIFRKPKNYQLINQARNMYDLQNISDDKIQEALDKCNNNIDEAVILLVLEQ